MCIFIHLETCVESGASTTSVRTHGLYIWPLVADGTNVNKLTTISLASSHFIASASHFSRQNKFPPTLFLSFLELPKTFLTGCFSRIPEWNAWQCCGELTVEAAPTALSTHLRRCSQSLESRVTRWYTTTATSEYTFAQPPLRFSTRSSRIVFGVTSRFQIQIFFFFFFMILY